jgi:hypothetical protein
MQIERSPRVALALMLAVKVADGDRLRLIEATPAGYPSEVVELPNFLKLQRSKTARGHAKERDRVTPVLPYNKNGEMVGKY